MSLVSVCLSLRGQAFGSRLDPGTLRSELLFSLGQLLENAPDAWATSIPVWPCAMKDSAWRRSATIPSAGSIAPGACLNQVYAGSYFRRMS